MQKNSKDRTAGQAKLVKKARQAHIQDEISAFFSDARFTKLRPDQHESHESRLESTEDPRRAGTRRIQSQASGRHVSVDNVPLSSSRSLRERLSLRLERHSAGNYEGGDSVSELRQPVEGKPGSPWTSPSRPITWSNSSSIRLSSRKRHVREFDDTKHPFSHLTGTSVELCGLQRQPEVYDQRETSLARQMTDSRPASHSMGTKLMQITPAIREAPATTEPLAAPAISAELGCDQTVSRHRTLNTPEKRLSFSQVGNDGARTGTAIAEETALTGDPSQVACESRRRESAAPCRSKNSRHECTEDHDRQFGEQFNTAAPGHLLEDPEHRASCARSVRRSHSHHSATQREGSVCLDALQEIHHHDQITSNLVNSTTDSKEGPGDYRVRVPNAACTINSVAEGAAIPPRAMLSTRSTGPVKQHHWHSRDFLGDRYFISNGAAFHNIRPEFPRTIQESLANSLSNPWLVPSLQMGRFDEQSTHSNENRPRSNSTWQQGHLIDYPNGDLTSKGLPFESPRAFEQGLIAEDELVTSFGDQREDGELTDLEALEVELLGFDDEQSYAPEPDRQRPFVAADSGDGSCLQLNSLGSTRPLGSVSQIQDIMEESMRGFWRPYKHY